MKLLLQILSLFAVLSMAAQAQAAHGIAMYGDLKYPSSFKNFDYVNPAAPKGGTFKLSANAPFDSMNPFILRGISAPGLQGYVLQTLMTPSYDEPQSYYALIADSVALAPDRSYADFTLNPAAKWDDGQPITADDVVWTFSTLKTQGHPFYRIQLKPITIEKTGPRSVRFHFEDKTRRELPLVAASLPVLPQHYYCDAQNPSPHRGEDGRGAPLAPPNEFSTHRTSSPPPQPSPYGGGSTSANDSRLTTHNSTCIPFDKTTLQPPLGSGPYRVASVDPGRSITYERVKNYWGANLPSQRGFYNFDTIRFDVYRDDVTALEGIKSHQFDFYEEFIARNWATAYDIPAVKSGQLIKTLIPHKIPRGMQGFLFNTRREKFTDRRVREAIGLTLDFEWMNKVLFYGAYERNGSYFNNTDFEAKGLPGKEELALLEPYRCHTPPPIGGRSGGGSSNCLPTSLFTTEYKVPTTDGSGNARANLIRAQQLLDDAGWVMKGGKRINAKTGEPLTVEFLMTQRTFERVVAAMRHNLARLGIASSFRYVDAAQYQRRVDHRDFDVISIWWNQGLFYPGMEQYQYWNSTQADVEGSQNLGGIKNPAVDMLTEKILRAQSLAELIPAGRALDRVLLNEHYVIPHWNLNAWRISYWNQFGRPKITPAYSYALDTWWATEPHGNRADKIGSTK